MFWGEFLYKVYDDVFFFVLFEDSKYGCSDAQWYTHIILTFLPFYIQILLVKSFINNLNIQQQKNEQNFNLLR